MLLHKMLRDMKNNISQFISIFIMAILGVLVYSGINAEWYGMKTELDKYYKETNMADIWLISNEFKKEDVEKVKNLPDVSNAALRLTFDSSVNMDSDKTLRINVMNDNIIASPKVIEGNPLDMSKDGLWLDDSFAKANKLKVGDKLVFNLLGSQIEKTILGLIIHPEYVYNVKDNNTFLPNPNVFGFAFLYTSAFQKELAIPYNQLLITKSSTGDISSISKELEAMFSDRYSILLNEDTHPSTSMFRNEIEQNKAIGGVFPVVFFLIAALTMLTTMTRMTTNQRIQIGTLKALGFSHSKILRHYVSYGIWIGLFGGLLGLVIGPLLIPPILFTMQKTIYTLPNWSARISSSAFIAVVFSVLCCSASSYFACYKQLKEVPAATLRPSVPKLSRHSTLEKSKVWHSFGFSAQWNLRDVIRSKVRSIATVIGVMGCTAILLFGLGLSDTINNVSNWMYKDLNKYENKINLKEEVTKEEIASLSISYKGQWLQEINIELLAGDEKESGSLMVLDVGEEIKFEDEKRNEIFLPKEGIALSYKMAKLLKVHVGDSVQWRVYGEKKWQSSVIKELYRTPMAQGISMKKQEFNRLGYSFKPTSLLTSDKVSQIEENTAVENLQHKNELISSFNEMLESMKMIIVILVLAAVILGSVVLYNLGILSFTERIRELATLKVLGFFPKQIHELLRMQNMWLTIIGIVLGIPAGYQLVYFMLSTMSDSTDMMAYVSPISLIISILTTFILSMLVSLILSLNVKKIDMITALKSVE